MKSGSIARCDVASPLAALNAYLGQSDQTTRAAMGLSPAAANTGPWPDLRSAWRFRQTLERLNAERLLQEIRARAPQNAGPLNPHRLMVETLACMDDLSPPYLRRFLAYAETLLWLEQAQRKVLVADTNLGLRSENGS